MRSTYCGIGIMNRPVWQSLALLLCIFPSHFVWAGTCLDYDGDGWGYNSQGSCQAPVESQVVIDCGMQEALSLSGNADFAVVANRVITQDGYEREGFEKYVIDMNNGESTKIPITIESNLISKTIGQTRISADGRLVLYSAFGQWQSLNADGTPDEGVTSRRSQIYLFDTESGDLNPIEIRGGYLGEIELSGNGSAVIYNTASEIMATAYYVSVLTGDTYEMVSDLNAEDVEQNYTRIVALSSNGRFALFSSVMVFGFPPQSISGMYLFDALSNTTTALPGLTTAGFYFETGLTGDHFSITDDGQTIVNGGNKIYEVVSNSYVSEPTGDFPWHAISPDGKYLTYFSEPRNAIDESLRTLNVLNRETGDISSVSDVSVPSRYDGYKFSADSRSIAFDKPDLSSVKAGELICGLTHYKFDTNKDCIDTDGDSWGWNGVRSCVVEQQPDGCDYSIAATQNGWGWNQSTDESCPPRPLDYCDYRQAASNDGWGWNHATRESCAPN